ncbi:hypothetical protein JCM8097_000954 [Rhodosporidiobolus ruineniae]
MSTGSVARPVSAALRAGVAPAPIASSSRLIARAIPSGSLSSTRTGRTCTCSSSTAHARAYSSYPSEKPAPAPFAPVPRKKRTILDLQNLKKKGIPITMLTAHDYPSGRFIESAALPLPPSAAPSSSSSALDQPSSGAPTSSHPRGIDICLVGDSLAMVACGYSNTNQLTLDELLFHCRSVARGCTTSLLVADLPFGTYTASIEQGLRNAVRLIQEGNMDAVKLEGGQEIVPIVQQLTAHGIPVMAHVGLTPQRTASLSGYRVQGKSVRSAVKVWDDARALQDAGAFAVVLEAVPSKLGKWVSERLDIPTIGIGAGQSTAGQVLVQLDMLGVDSELGASGKGPRFLKRFGEVGEMARRAVREYVDEVREGKFPEEGTHTYPVSDEAWEGFLKAVEGQEGKK